MTTRDEIEARLKAITPGPWVVKRGAGWFITRPEATARREAAIAVGMTEQGNLICDPEASWEVEGRAQANAELMANAPTDLRHLLDALAAAEAEIERLFSDAEFLLACLENLAEATEEPATDEPEDSAVLADLKKRFQERRAALAQATTP